MSVILCTGTQSPISLSHHSLVFTYANMRLQRVTTILFGKPSLSRFVSTSYSRCPYLDSGRPSPASAHAPSNIPNPKSTDYALPPTKSTSLLQGATWCGSMTSNPVTQTPSSSSKDTPTTSQVWHFTVRGNGWSPVPKT